MTFAELAEQRWGHHDSCSTNAAWPGKECDCYVKAFEHMENIMEIVDKMDELIKELKDKLV